MLSLPLCCQFYWGGDLHWDGNSVLSFFPAPKWWKLLSTPLSSVGKERWALLGKVVNTQHTHVGKIWCVVGIVTETLPNLAEVSPQSDRA